ncbi:EAL domain-containing protein [Yersinia intermedia]|jgi:EAL domain-containing protein (putative c-di-GMP-specific phosphodiesterase class I)|uniref:EAL domain-containing protein n=1 Tax=Yersinia intermedia TaxID=631 RepID=A0ABX6F361_YERIN|nr:EAL domain-containing protein [Yersinia intermedia]EEQ18917.1 EAL domain [Yersinia intermedia ATCC 29909]MDA5495546.1 EAL domain-containing protein [Yersinia intermedia]MDN0113745.1 EAL domain-containing protein [Yersinia intermedia]OVZ77481.1 hypothetical protein CBW55_02175 [Yersinia intermedia]QGR68430.1 EAL domain-containing protein [Yersinia intermedia]
MKKNANESKKIDVLNAIISLSQDRNILPGSDSELWPNTRQVAELCDLTIYKARYLLLKLTNEGLVDLVPHGLHNSLHWRLHTQEPAHIRVLDMNQDGIQDNTAFTMLEITTNEKKLSDIELSPALSSDEHHQESNGSTLLVTISGVRYSLNLVFEPLYSPKGVLIALEALTRLRSHDTSKDTLLPTDFYMAVTSNVASQILDWQLQCLMMLKSWLEHRGVRVSLNVNRVLAHACIDQADTLKTLSPLLRLEINEHFFTQKIVPDKDPLLHSLARICPLWLDDFGIGSANLQALMTRQFEAIKLDASVFRRLNNSLSGHLFIDALRQTAAEVGTRLVIEGVETAEHLAELSQSGAWALQGWYWPAFSAEDLLNSNTIKSITLGKDLL